LYAGATIAVAGLFHPVRQLSITPGGMMTEALIDLDGGALAEAVKVRAAAVARMRAMVAEGEVDFSVIEETTGS
jgi:hypothetical protein